MALSWCKDQNRVSASVLQSHSAVSPVSILAEVNPTMNPVLSLVRAKTDTFDVSEFNCL